MRTFPQLFIGRTDCYGIYIVEGKGKKKKGRGITYPNSKFPDKTLTQEQWDEHLSGDTMLGIVPVRPDGLCSWFAIDVDDYDLNHKSLVKIIEKNNIPLVVCKSKSGGAHCYCFINGAIEASVAIQMGKLWAGEIGYPDAEIFPKQTKPTDIGNWIIVPYFGGDNAVDHGLGISGEKLSIDEFVQLANAKQLAPDEALTFIVTKKKQDRDDKKLDINRDNVLFHAPPCIQHAYREGVTEGGRNKFTFHTGVFWKRVDEYLETDNYEEELYKLNDQHYSPKLDTQEVTTIIKNLKSDKYSNYTCRESPQADWCDKETCLKQFFGIGTNLQAYGEVLFDKVIKQNSDPPVWTFYVNNQAISMSTEQVTHAVKFRNKILEKTNVLCKLHRGIKHDDLIRDLIDTCFTVVDADDILPGKIILETFKEWVANQVNMARDRADILKKLPHWEEPYKRVVFRFQDFYLYYKQSHKENTPRNMFSLYMRQEGFQYKTMKISTNTGISVWYYETEDKWWDDEEDDF